MADYQNTKARLRAIRKLAGPSPDSTAADRLERIEGIASGKISAEMGRVQTSPTLMTRLAAGQASRSPRSGDSAERQAKGVDPKPAEVEEETSRKARKTRDRKETGGQDRAEE